MTFFKNMKISGKLFLGFALMVLITAGIAIYGTINLMQVNNSYTYILENPFERYQALREIQVGMMNARRIMNRSAMYINDPNDPIGGINSQEILFREQWTRIDAEILRYRESVRLDPDFTDERKAELQGIMDHLEGSIHHYFNHYVVPLMEAGRLGDEVETIRLVRQGVDTVNEVNYYFDQLFVITQNVMVRYSSDMNSLTRQTYQTKIALTVIGVILSVVICLILTGAIRRPLAKMIEAADKVSRGDLTMDLGTNGKDEFSLLQNSFAKIIDTLRGLTKDLILAQQKFHGEGDVEFRLDPSRYENSYKDIADKINGLMNGSVNDVMTVLDAMGKISNGDFNVEVSDLPGKKMVLPTTVRSVVGNLKEVYESTNYLANNAANGNLNVSIDSSKFSGSWADLLNTLNNLLISVNKPLSAIETALNHMQQGNFEGAKINAEFKGTFDNVKRALNTTEEITQGYINEISTTLAAMSKGDLTVSIRGDYIGAYAPIKEALNTILSSLNQVMGDIKVATDQVVSGIDQISKSSMHLAEGAQEQTNAVQDLVSSIAIINEKANQSSTNAINANQRTSRSEESARTATNLVKSMASTMDKVKASSQSIGKIISVINDIAFQTNLLALNAAVEAARAGEHGKGFSVVAEEVRSLAGKSQQSAQDTTVIIAEDANVVDEGIKAMAEVVASFDVIGSDIVQISELVSQITGISEEQLELIASVNNSVTEISKVVASNSATAEESASASEEINAQADMLDKMVSFFKLKK